MIAVVDVGTDHYEAEPKGVLIRDTPENRKLISEAIAEIGTSLPDNVKEENRERLLQPMKEGEQKLIKSGFVAMDKLEELMRDEGEPISEYGLCDVTSVAIINTEW